MKTGDKQIMPKRKTRSRGRSRQKRKKRPYAFSKAKHARRRHTKRHPKSRVHGHHGRMHREAKMMNFLLNNILKVAEDPEHKHNPRHYSKDPEYKHSSDRLQRFKRSFPAPDVSMLRPPHPGRPVVV